MSVGIGALFVSLLALFVSFGSLIASIAVFFGRTRFDALQVSNAFRRASYERAIVCLSALEHLVWRDQVDYDEEVRIQLDALWREQGIPYGCFAVNTRPLQMLLMLIEEEWAKLMVVREHRPLNGDEVRYREGATVDACLNLERQLATAILDVKPGTPYFYR